MSLSIIQQEKIKELLLRAIEERSIPFPDIIEAERVHKINYYKYESRGGMDLKFIVHPKPAEDLYVIDLYFVTDDYSSHKRIDEFGNITNLENFEGQFGWPILADEDATMKEHQRMKEHNHQVLKILKTKGFED